MAAESSTVDKRKSIGTENRKSSSSKSNSVYGKRLSIGDVFPIALLKTIDGVEVPLIGGKGLIYLQLRRFSGCPLCNLQLSQMSKFSKELADEGISSVVVMHSSQEILQENQGQFMWSKAFEFIADPSREIYKKVGAEPNRWYLINPIFFLRAIAKFGPFAPQENKEIIKVTSKMRSGGEIHTQAPVDMILDTSTGQVMDIDYGKSPLDGWSPKEAEKRFKEVKIKQSYGEVPSITVQESND